MSEGPTEHPNIGIARDAEDMEGPVESKVARTRTCPYTQYGPCRVDKLKADKAALREQLAEAERPPSITFEKSSHTLVIKSLRAELAKAREREAKLRETIVSALQELASIAVFCVPDAVPDFEPCLKRGNPADESALGLTYELLRSALAATPPQEGEQCPN